MKIEPQSFEMLRWILLPLGAIVLGVLFSSRPVPQWSRSLALVVVSVGVSIVLLGSLTASLHSRRISLEQSHSPIKYESYVSHSGHAH